MRPGEVGRIPGGHLLAACSAQAMQPFGPTVRIHAGQFPPCRCGFPGTMWWQMCGYGSSTRTGLPCTREAASQIPGVGSGAGSVITGHPP